MRNCVRAGLLLCLGAGWCQAQVSNLTGLWKLNVARSSWGQKQKPVSLWVDIAHHEPALKYEGMVVDANGDGRHFSFEGAIDGQGYFIESPFGEGTIAFRRVDSRTLSSVFKSANGVVTESVTLRVSRDGKMLTQQLRVKDPAGELSWTEVYEKK